MHQYFSENYRATIGVDFALKVINWTASSKDTRRGRSQEDDDEDVVIRLQLWDIAGEFFGFFIPFYTYFQIKLNAKSE